jgi:hypothetical protein
MAAGMRGTPADACNLLLPLRSAVLLGCLVWLGLLLA